MIRSCPQRPVLCLAVIPVNVCPLVGAWELPGRSMGSGQTARGALLRLLGPGIGELGLRGFDRSRML